MGTLRRIACTVAITMCACTGSIEGSLGPSAGEGSRWQSAGPSSNGSAGGAGGAPGGDPANQNGAAGTNGGTGTNVGAGGTGGSVGGIKAGLTCEKRGVGAAPFRRLTKVQYARTVEDLFGIAADVSAFPSDDTTHGFEVGLNLSSLLIEAYGDAAEDIAARADLKKLVPCDPAQGEEACAKSFIESFSRRAFRRATSEEERARLFTVYTAGRTNGTFDRGARMVIQSALMAPSFLYHVEQTESSDADGLRKLSPYALANRLSYLVWGSLPDVALLDAAGSGKLATSEGLEAEARRLISARPLAAKSGLRDFYRQWLSLAELDTMERDKTRYPEFTRTLAAHLGESLARQIDATVWDRGGSIDDLLRGQSVFVNASVAPLFGLTAKDASFIEVAMAPQRRGILTHPALLSVLAKANQSDPVIRGKFVRERLLCQTLPPPPPNVATVPPDPKPGLTTRQRFAEHSNNATCAGCHKLMDPIGFGFENFDALGRYRTTDEGVAVDARGEIVSSVDADGVFEGTAELAERLAGSESVRECVATQYFRFALGRTETVHDSCSLVGTFERLNARTGSIQELILGVVTSDAFRYLAAQGTP